MPENALLITISDSGRVFYSITGAEVRKKVLKRMADQYKIDFTAKQYEEFAGMSSFGVGMKNLGAFINTEPGRREKFPSKGIPMDSSNNQLKDWINFGRYEGAMDHSRLKDEAKAAGRALQAEPLRYAIKADSKTNYIVVKEVIKTFTDLKIFRFNLLTNFEKGEEQ